MGEEQLEGIILENRREGPICPGEMTGGAQDAGTGRHD